MIELLKRIGERLQSSAYVNEAAISHGIVMPLLGALGWDTADPRQVVPEFSNPRGRVDFALLGAGSGPVIFIEVKQPGRASEGEGQLFEYAFHQGVPLCVLTDGREWSFYLPSGQGSYEDRRVYRLQIDERSPEECQEVLARYLLRQNVLDKSAFENARLDYHTVAGRREAVAVLPRAWADLVRDTHELIVETLVEKAESLCGYAPSEDDVATFLRSLRPSGLSPTNPAATGDGIDLRASANARAGATHKGNSQNLALTYTLFGQTRSAPNASAALGDILRAIVEHRGDRLAELSDASRTKKRRNVARTTEEIYPKRPGKARAVEISGGWLVGLNIANREKAMIIRAACQVYGLAIPGDVDVEFPNA